jgi:hypothetical protein
MALAAVLSPAPVWAEGLFQSEPVRRGFWVEMSDEGKAALMLLIVVLCIVVLWQTRRR